MNDTLVGEIVDKALSQLCGPDTVRTAEAHGWSAQLWDDVSEMGLPWISLNQDRGGSGGSLSDAIDMLVLAGRRAVPLPLAECSLLAGWLLIETGLDLDGGVLTYPPGCSVDHVELRNGRLCGRVHRVPWGRAAKWLVLLAENNGQLFIVVAPTSEMIVDADVNLAGEPRDILSFDLVPKVLQQAPSGVNFGSLRLRGSLSRVAMIAGALERLTELTVEYAHERRQFGRRLNAFQAVQQHLVECVQQTELVKVALAAAVNATSEGTGEFAVYASKMLANRAATGATQAAHQAHGAMGLTREYALQLFSRRLWAWRSEYGTNRELSALVSGIVCRAGADTYYELISSGVALVPHARAEG